jgi:hypothetical protein
MDITLNKLGMVYSAQEDRLYKKERLLWRAFPRPLTLTSPRRGISKYRKSNTLSRVPAEDLVHASVDDCRGDITTKVSTEYIPAPILFPTPTLSFEDIRRSRHAGFSWAISEVTVPANATVLASALVRGKAIAVSDGSFKNAQGTAGFVIEGDTRCGRLVGVNINLHKGARSGELLESWNPCIALANLLLVLVLNSTTPTGRSNIIAATRTLDSMHVLIHIHSKDIQNNEATDRQYEGHSIHWLYRWH